MTGGALGGDAGPTAWDLISTWVGSKYRIPVDIERFIALLDESPLEERLKEAIDTRSLINGRDLYVSVFPSSGGIIPDLLHSLKSKESQFIRIQDVPDEAHKLLLASAALPLAFRAQEIQGKVYRDGGMGGRITAQGNTPVQPIVEAGCSHAIVVMTGSGSMFGRYEWPLTMLEIRPSRLVLPKLSSTMGFRPGALSELMAMGEKDALDSLTKVYQAIHTIASHGRAVEQVRKLNERDDTDIERMKELQAAVEEALAKGLPSEEPE